MNELLKQSMVSRLDSPIAGTFIKNWHYSERVPTGKNLFFAWTIPHQSWGDLFGVGIYAVACYGIGVNCYQAEFLSKLLEREISSEDLLELKRLCRREPKINKLPLTAFLSRCHKLLKHEGFKFIVSFSDPAYGHNGGIYKAANFQHLGKTQEEFHLIDVDGNIRHRRLAQRYMERHGGTIEEARSSLGMKRHATPPKDRWILIL